MTRLCWRLAGRSGVCLTFFARLRNLRNHRSQHYGLSCRRTHTHNFWTAFGPEKLARIPPQLRPIPRTKWWRAKAWGLAWTEILFYGKSSEGTVAYLGWTLLCQLDGYQEQSYLLDPFLEELVTPIVETLKVYAISIVENPTKSSSSIRVSRVSVLLYHFFKLRGYKTISQSASEWNLNIAS